jgi:hypothetical protein
LPIHQQGVVGFVAQADRLGQALAPIDHVAIGAQEVSQAFAEDGIVFDQEESHGAEHRTYRPAGRSRAG